MTKIIEYISILNKLFLNMGIYDTHNFKNIVKLQFGIQIAIGYWIVILLVLVFFWDLALIKWAQNKIIAKFNITNKNVLVILDFLVIILSFSSEIIYKMIFYRR